MKNSSYLIAASFLFIMMCSLSNSAYAQTNQSIFQEIEVESGTEYKYHVPKSHIINFGVGFPNKLGLTILGFNKFDDLLKTDVIEGGSASPQLTLSYEYAVDKQLGIGAHVGYFSATTPKINFDFSEVNDILGGTNLDGLNDLLGEDNSLNDLLGESNILDDFLGEDNILDDLFGEDNILDDFLGEDNSLNDLLGEGNIDDLLGEGSLDNLLDEACEESPLICDLKNITGLQEFLQGSQKIRVWTFSGRIAYHQRIIPKLDVYAATVLGYSLIKIKSLSINDDNSKGNSDQVSASFKSLTIPNYSYYGVGGGRYYLTEHIAIYGEGGYGNITFANAGLTYRF